MTMMKPAKMQKIRLVALKSVARPLLAELHRLGMVEIRRFESGGFETGKTMDMYDSISSNLIRMRAIKSMLGLKGQFPEDLEMDLETTLKKAEAFHIEEGLRKKHTQLDDCTTEISALKTKLKNVEKLSSFNIDFSKIDTKTLSVIVGTVPASNLSLLKRNLKDARMDSHIVGREGVVVLAYPADDPSVEMMLGRCGFLPIDLEGITTPPQTKKDLQSKILKFQEEKEELKQEISALAKKYGKQVIELEYLLSLWEIGRAHV